MALIPVTFKHSTETGKEKSGKVSTITARMLYANTFSGKVGIVKGYKKDDATDELSVAYDNTATTSTTFRLVFNKGAVSIYGGIGIIEQGTILDIARGLTNNSVGIRINLANPAGQEMEWYVKSSSETLQKDDLQIHDTDGVYEFELFKITTTGTTPTVSEKTTEYIQSVEEYIEDRLNRLGFKEGSVSLSSGITASKNIVTRQGNYVIGNLVCNVSSNWYFNQSHKQFTKYIGNIPEEFRPKEDITVAVSGQFSGNASVTAIQDGYVRFYCNALIEASTGNITLYCMGVSNTNEAWVFLGNNDGISPTIMTFGYEANPL